MDKSSSEQQLNVNSQYIIDTFHGNLLIRLLSLPSQLLRNSISFTFPFPLNMLLFGTGQLKCDGTRAETIFRLSAKRTSPFKSAWASVRSTTGSQGVRISGSNAGYTMFRGNVKDNGYPMHSPVSPSFPLPCVTVCHHISTGVYVISYYAFRHPTFKAYYQY